MRLIDADGLKDFFFSETSGTEEIINDLMMKHNLDYAHGVNEDEVMDFAEELLKKVRNVIDTEPTVDTRQIREDAIDDMVVTLSIEPFSAYVMDIVRHRAKRLKEKK